MSDLSESIGTPGNGSPEGNGHEAPLTHRQDAVVDGMYGTAKKVAEQEVTLHAAALGYGENQGVIIEALAHAATRLAVRTVGHEVPITQFEVAVRRNVQILVQQLLQSRRVVWSTLAAMSGNGVGEIVYDAQWGICSMSGISDEQVTGVMQHLRDSLCELPLKSTDPSPPSEEKVRRLVEEAMRSAKGRKNGS